MSLLAQLDIIIGIVALCLLCVFLHKKTGLSPSLAPLAALSLIALYLLCFGLLGILQIALYGGYLLCAVLGFTAAFSKKPTLQARGDAAVQLAHGQEVANEQKSAQGVKPTATRALFARAAHIPFAAAAFWVASLCFLVYFAFLQPEFTSYDEYSFWGTAAKQTSIYGQLYSECPIGTPWQATEFTALALLSYFFQGFGAFSAWKAIFACNILLLAGLCAVLHCAEHGVMHSGACAENMQKNALFGAGNWRLTAPLLCVVLLAPSFFTLYSHAASVSSVWLSFLGDLPAGVLFGAAVAFWLALRDGAPRQYWVMIPVLCLAANIKNNTFVLALAAAGVIAVDCFFFAPSQTRTGKALYARCSRAGFGLLCLGAPLVQYVVWSNYSAARVAEKLSSGGYGATSQSLVSVVINGVKLVLGMPTESYYETRSETFTAYVQSMASLFQNEKIAMIGTGAAVAVLVLVLFAFALCFAQGLREKVRVACIALCTSVCFGLYWFMLLLSYAFILKDSSPESPTSYARYFGSYYLGWFLIALAVLCSVLRRAQGEKAALAAKGVALALCLLFVGKAVAFLEPQFSVLGVSEGQFATVRTAQALAEVVQESISPDETLFLVDDGDDGYRWFMYSQLLYPIIVEYGTGGGTYGLAEYAGNTTYYYAYLPEEFLAAVHDSGADYVLVVENSERFSLSYAALFDDALENAADGTALYRVAEDGFTYVPFVQEAEGVVS